MRRLWAWVTMVLLGGVAWAACDDGGANIYTPGDGGSGGIGGIGRGVGEPCEVDGQCRSGLVCEGGLCAPGHNKAEGDECVISAECQDGLYCADGLCAPAGDGVEGDSCATDADCASGFRCALQGFTAICVPEGNVDLGGECSVSTDCFGGLACVEGVCAQVPPGTPPFGPPFAGVDCEDPSEAGVEAYFRVPRGGDTGDFFRLPFPNDVRLTGVSLDLDGFPTPGDALLGYDPVQRYVDAVESTNDGWGMYQSVYFRFSGQLDSATIQQQGSVHLVDLTAGTGLGLYWLYAQSRTNYICHNHVLVRRSHGRTYEPGHTYAAYITTVVKDENGDDVQRPDDLVALLSDAVPSDPEVEAHWDKYGSFRLYLDTNAVDRDTVLNASVFTVGQPRAVVEQLQGVIDADVPTASGWTLCDSGVTSPCPDASGPRACPAADANFHELHALVELPIFQRGTAPYFDDGGDLDTSGGAPVVVRTEAVCLSLTVPKGAMPAAGWPTVVFAHGTGGHFRSHVESGAAEALALGVDDGEGTLVKAAMLGIDQVQHGPRRGTSMQAPSDLFFNYANPAAAQGNPQQGAADQMALLRFVPTVDFTTGSPTGTPFNLSNVVAFWGHSQGATHGGIATPYADWSGALFSGQGGSLKDSLTTKTNPVNIAGVLPFVLGDFNVDGQLPHGRNHPVPELMQLYMDGSDPIAYAPLLALSPPAPLAARHVFQIYGLADTFTTSDVQSAYAISAGLGLAQHDTSVSTVEPIGSLDEDDEVPVPASGNLDIGGKIVTAFVREYAPSGGNDGHHVVFDVTAANADALRFLAGCLSGIAPEVGP